MDDGFGSETMPIFAIAEELGKLNEENFESRRRDLSQSVVNLQNDIWETLLTALVLGAIIAGASVFRISSLEKESAAHQKVSELAEVRLRHLSQQLVSSQEQERKALSRELHDEIGQLLTALRMELGNLERGRGDAGRGDAIRIWIRPRNWPKARCGRRAISRWDCGRPCWTSWDWGRRWNGRLVSASLLRPFCRFRAGGGLVRGVEPTPTGATTSAAWPGASGALVQRICPRASPSRRCASPSCTRSACAPRGCAATRRPARTLRRSHRAPHAAPGRPRSSCSRRRLIPEKQPTLAVAAIALAGAPDRGTARRVPRRRPRAGQHSRRRSQSTRARPRSSARRLHPAETSRRRCVARCACCSPPDARDTGWWWWRPPRGARRAWWWRARTTRRRS